MVLVSGHRGTGEGLLTSRGLVFFVFLVEDMMRVLSNNGEVVGVKRRVGMAGRAVDSMREFCDVLRVC